MNLNVGLLKEGVFAYVSTNCVDCFLLNILLQAMNVLLLQTRRLYTQRISAKFWFTKDWSFYEVTAHFTKTHLNFT